MKKLLLYLVLLCNTIGVSQNKKLDSLIGLLTIAKEDTNKLYLYDKICFIHLRKHSYVQTLEYAYPYLDLAKKLNYIPGQKNVYHLLGRLHFEQGNYNLAIDNFIKSLKMSEKLGDEESNAACCLNIASVLAINKEYEKALTYYQKCHDYLIALKDSSNLGKVYGDMGIVYKEIKDFEKAIEYELKALELESLLMNKQGMALSSENLGTLYSELNNNKKALDYFIKAYRIEKEINDTYGLSSTCVNMGGLYNKMRDYKVAITFLDTGLYYAEKLNSKDVILSAYNHLADSYEGLNDYKKEKYYLRKFIQLNDTIFSEEKSQQISELQTKYDTEKKENEIKSLGQENQIQSLKLSQKNYIMIGLSVLFVLFILLATLLFKQNKLKAEQRSIQLEQKLLRLQMNPHFIFNSLIAIESFIHTKQPDEAREYLADFAKLMRLILENSREEIVSLQKEIDTLNYYLRLQKLTLEDTFTYNVSIGKDIDSEEIQLPPMLIQPFIENAIKHGIKDIAKGHIEIIITKENENLIIEIKDNGKGIFENENKSSHTSLATTITKERLLNINLRKKQKIEFKVQSLEFKGTRVLFTIPLV